MVSLDIEIGGKVRPVLFNMNQRIRYCRTQGISTEEMNKQALSPHEWDESVTRDLVYSALYAGVKSDKGVVDFDEEDVGEWIEEMEDEELSKVFQALLDSNNSGEEEEPKKKVKA